MSQTLLRVLCTFTCVLALSLPAAAQEQTGTITGIVRDNSGAVLPGASVEAESIARGTVVGTTTTDNSGRYRFVGLLPGLYNVTARLQGFSANRVEQIDLRLGQLLTVDLALAVGGVAETIQVTAESPLIASKQSAKSFSIDQELIAKLPGGRDFSSYVTTAPGANQEARSGGISIDGSSASENRFIVDGVETTDPQRGVQGKRLSVDFIGELQVKSSGYEAEFGGSTGGVINVVTKSGTNSFRGDLGAYITGSGLQGNARRTLRRLPTDSTKAEYVTFDKDSNTNADIGFTFGGPILSNRLWFFTSYLPQVVSTDRTTNLSDGSRVTKTQEFISHNSSSNVTAQPADSMRFKVAYNLSSSKTTGVLPGQSLRNENGSTAPTALFGINTVNPNWSFSGNFDWVPTANLTFGVRGGFYNQNRFTEGIPVGPLFNFQTQNIGLAGVPAEFQHITGFTNVVTNNGTTRDTYKRTNLQVDGTWYGQAGGDHVLRGGVQFDTIGNDVLAGETGNRVLLFWDRSFAGQRGTYGYYRVRSNGVSPQLGFITEGDISNTNVGLFIQDTWTIGNRLTLNIGIRTENESVPSYTTSGGIAPVAIKWGFGDKFAPRLGFAWDVNGDGKTKVYGNWGVFYDIFKMELPRGSFGGDKWLEYYYTMDRPDFPNLITGAGCPPACSGTLIRGPVDFRHPSNSPGDETIDPNLDPMKLQEASFGIERQVGARMAVGVRYIHKQVDVAIEDVGALEENFNEIYTIGNPGFGAAKDFFPFGSTTAVPFPKAVRDYDAVEFLFDKRLSNNWTLRTSYTFSRLYGNYSGLSQSDENGRTSPNVGRAFDYPLMAFDGDGQPVYGLLATDRPHQFKLQGFYDFTFGTTVGLNFYGASGVPVTREAAAIQGNNFPIQYKGRLSDGRTAVFSQTGVFIQHRFDFNGKGLQLSMNVDNLFDQEGETDKFRTQLAVGEAVDFDEPDFFAGRINFDQEIANLGPANLVIDPRFLQTSAFQAPRVIRFNVKFLF